MQPKEIYQKNILLIAGGIILCFLFEFLLPSPNFIFPYNLWIVIFLFVFSFSFYILLRNKKIFVFLSSVHTSISILTIYLFFLLIMGFLPQNDNNSLISKFGLTHIVVSYPFVFISLYLILNLLLVIWKRLFFPMNFKNVAFLFNHIGILIVLIFGNIAGFDLIKLDMYAEKNKPVWYGFDDRRKIKELPFAIELKDFKIEFYKPNIQLLKIENENKLKLIKQAPIDKNNIELGNAKIKILKKVNYAWFFEDSVFSSYTPGYTKAIYAEIVTPTEKINTWLSYGTIAQKSRFVRLGNYVITLSEPQPKKYVSYVKVYTKDEKVYEDSILVNHPLDIYGWKIYQKDYDHDLGEFSNVSIFEVNYDRWLSVIYFGIYMMVIGAVLLMFTVNKGGKNVNNL